MHLTCWTSFASAFDLHIFTQQLDKSHTEHARRLAQPGKPCEGVTPPASYSYVERLPEHGKLYLDSFAIGLRGERSKTGYIIAYAGKRATAGEAAQRARYAKDYLIKVRRVSPDQIKTIDGGYREAPTIELFAVETEGCAPMPNPTIDPRDVQIIKDGHPGKRNRSSLTTRPSRIVVQR